MLRRIVVWVTLYSFVFFLTGCYSTRNLLLHNPDDIKQLKQELEVRDDSTNILSAVALDETTHTPTRYDFQMYLGCYGVIKDSVLVGRLSDGKMISLPLSQIQSVNVVEYDPKNTTQLIVGGIFVAGLIALIYVINSTTYAKQPTVY